MKKWLNKYGEFFFLAFLLGMSVYKMEMFGIIGFVVAILYKCSIILSDEIILAQEQLQELYEEIIKELKSTKNDPTR